MRQPNEHEPGQRPPLPNEPAVAQRAQRARRCATGATTGPLTERDNRADCQVGPSAATVRTMQTEHVHQRLHDALHRGNTKVTETELVEITAIVLAIVAEVATELAAVIGELAQRVTTLENK